MDPPLTRSFEARLDEMAGMRRLARSLLRDASLADDVVQEAALAAWKRARASEAPPRSWWAAVVRNVAAKMGRGARRREERERAAARPEAQPGADVVARRLALHRAVVAAVERLSPEQRDVVVRRWFDGQKPQRIAAELDVPLATVKTRLRRALEQLRSRLRDEWGDGVAAALMTLTRPCAVPVAAASITGGVLLMASKMKFVTALVVVAAAFAWIAVERWSRERSAPQESTTISSTEAASTTEPSALSPAPTVVRDKALAPPALEDARRFAEVTGVVKGPSGTIAGARVDLVRRIGEDVVSHPVLRETLIERRNSTTSAADGSFRFADVRLGDLFAIEASADPDLERTTSSTIQAGDHVEVVLAPLARLTGVVRRVRGGTIGGAMVVLSPAGPRAPSIEHQATTDAAGRFSLERLGAGSWNIFACTAAGELVSPRRVELRAAQITEVELEAGDALAINGVLLDTTSGAPIAGAQIFGEAPLCASVPLATSDERGEFHLQAAELWPSSSQMFVRAEGYGFRSFNAPAPAFPPPHFEVRLLRGRAIRGRIIDVDGRPLADAIIAFAGASDLSSGNSFHASNEQGAARSAADGTFLLRDVDPRADHSLGVRHGGSTQSEVFVPGDASSTDDVDVGDITMHPTALVTGRVIDVERHPVARAYLLLDFVRSGGGGDARERLRRDFSEADLDRRGITRSDGSFAIAGVKEGNWILRQGGRDPVWGRKMQLSVRAGEIVEGIEWVVGESLSLSGNVVDEAGNPVSHAGVECFVPEAGWRYRASTTRSGAFTIDGLASGSYRVVARVLDPPREGGRRFAEARLEGVAADRSDLSLVLRDGAPLVGRVTTADGQPADRSRVVALDVHGDTLSETTCDDSGRFELVVPESELKRGTVKLHVRSAPHGTLLHPDPVSEATLELVRLGADELVIRLP